MFVHSFALNIDFDGFELQNKLYLKKLYLEIVEVYCNKVEEENVEQIEDND